MAHPPLDLAPGALLVGKYRLERPLGRGGMGVVWAALHEELGRAVALKFPAVEQLESPARRARFAREGRVLASLASERTVRVLDVGTTEDGVPFLVLERLEGEDLAAKLARRGPLELAEAAGHVLEICDALGEAHARGVVHRDLKPSNVFVARAADGSLGIKVLDFGIAKAGLEGVEGVTRTSDFLGSPAYASPEQLRSAGHVTPRADIWALGVLLHELLTGRPPFEGTSAEVSAAILAEGPVALAPSVPVRARAALLRCLARDAAARFETVLELATAVAEWLPQEDARRALGAVERWSRAPREDATLDTPAPSGAAVEPTQSAVAAHVSVERPSRRLPVVGLTLAATAAVVAVVLAASPAREPAGAPSAAAPRVSSAVAAGGPPSASAVSEPPPPPVPLTAAMVSATSGALASGRRLESTAKPRAKGTAAPRVDEGCPDPMCARK